MKIEKIDIYNDNPKEGVNNEYPTPKNSFRQPCLQLIVGVRYTGKSYLTSKILAQAKKDKTFNRIYIVTPSFKSNEAYFGEYINEEDVFEPTKDSIDNVIKSVEADRDEFEEFLIKKEVYKKFKRDLNKIKLMDQDDYYMYEDFGFFNQEPVWKYASSGKIEPPKSLLILDDCLASPAILQSSGLTKVATLNRHVAPLSQPHSGRSACGLGVIILSQSYRMSSGQGFSRVLRENLSLLTLFLNKQQKQLDAIKEELANVVDVNLFDEAYKYATKDKFGNLTIDFKSKCKTMTFRKNLNELIKFDELSCECNK
jgi:hypothetical protein